MKNKLSKLLATFMLLSTIAATIPYIAHAESGFKLIESSDGNTLVVHNEVPGGLYEILKDEMTYYEHVKISGKMNISDFVTLRLLFSDCKSIDLCNVDVKSIPIHTFCDMYKLEKFICPNNLETIERRNFISCLSLKTVVLPEALKYIGNGCFRFCKNLELTVPESVEIGRNIYCEDTSSFRGSPNVSYVMKELKLEPEQPADDLKKGQIRCKSLIYYIMLLFK